MQGGAWGAGYTYNADGNPSDNVLFLFTYDGHGRMVTAYNELQGPARLQRSRHAGAQ